MSEAHLDETDAGLVPEADGWFVVNVREAEWWTSSPFGSWTAFEGEQARFPQFGINVTVLEPGKPSCVYHSESQQEAFLVVSGECTLLVEGEERQLRAWDFFHCPPGTAHVMVGAGEEACVVIMAGARTPDETVLYPVTELAARYGASAEQDTGEPQEAYARFEKPQRGRPPYWDSLPWA